MTCKVSATSIGHAAWHVMLSGQPASVIGVTSRGLFLLVPPQRVIFVSFERYRSPLTITIDRSADQLRLIEIGAAAQFSGNRLIFPSIECFISLPADVVWHSPSPGSAVRSRREQQQALRAIAEGVLARKRGDGLTALLPRLADLPDVSPLTVEHSTPLDRLLALRGAVQAGESQSALAGLISLLGEGRGLTPSGDDVVIGLLLMLTRFPQVNSQSATENVLKQVAAPLLAEAYQRTTAISANLIECAADGQGDERLITVVDGIAAGSASIDECVDCILDWGSSSGIDALVGMAIAVPFCV